jgi:long-chain acyl-CoA synthetase
MSESLESKVLSHGIKYPDKLAVVTKNEQVTYADICKRIKIFVNSLRKLGIKENDTVIIQAIASSDYIAAYIAVHCVGAVAVPLDRKAVEESVRTMKTQLNAGYIIRNLQLQQKVNETILYDTLYSDCETDDKTDVLERNKSDIYDILFTTGTTGQSKGVVTTGQSVLAAIANEIEGSGLTAEDVLLIPIPLNHSFGLGKLRAALYVGATVVLQNGVSMVTELKNNIDKFQCTAMICVPSALQIISNQSGDRLKEVLGGMHFIEVASAPFSVELKEHLMQQLPDVHIINRYGSTETPAAIYLDIKEAPSKIASIGKALSNVRVKIVSDERSEIASSKENIGKLAISGNMLMQGYYKDDELTHSVLENGWLYSKDMAYIDSDGYIYLAGRDDDVINTGGKKFSPLEVEDILMKSGYVKECVIVAVPDPQKVLGNVPVLAYVPMTEECVEDDIIAYLKKHIEKYKIPVQCMRIKSLPRNYMGKLERKKVRQLFMEE